MGRKKPTTPSFPEMNTLFEGMQELLTDEDGNPLTPQHPQYKKVTGLIEHITKTMEIQNQKNSVDTPEGQA